MQILDHDNQGRMIYRVECHDGRKDHKSQCPRGGADFQVWGGGGGGGANANALA